MDFINKQFRQVGAHLGALTVSQRLALALSVIVLVGGAAWMWQWAGATQLVPLLDQPMKAEEVTAIENQLRASGQSYRLEGGQVLVPADERSRLQGQIAQVGLMPADTSIGFAKLIEESNLWLPREESRWQRKIALGNELAKVVSHFDGVTEARVFIDQPERRGFGDNAAASTASVYLRTRAGAAFDKQHIAAIAALVSGAVHGLRAEDVRMVDATTGRSFRVPTPDDATSFDMMDLRRQKEDHFGQKILSQLSYIQGVLVGVNVDLDSDHRREHKEKFGPAVPSEEQSVTSESQGMTAASGPGVRPNTRASISGPGSSESMTSEESHTTLLGDRDKTVTDTSSTPGGVRLVTASVNIPRSYFVSIFKQINPGRDPQQKDLDALIVEEERKVRLQVKPLISAAKDEQVEVSWFFDAPAPATSPAESHSVAAMARDYGKPALLGVLAFVSLFWVFRMSRRVMPGGSGGMSAGRAAMSLGAAAGLRGAPMTRGETKGPRGPGRFNNVNVELPQPEVDAATARVQRMVTEIDQLSQEEPDMAVGILSRWVTQGR